MPRSLFILLFVIAAVFLVDWLAPHDDSDPAGGRSGLRIYVDYRTSCQYLAAGWLGGLTPRLDNSGRQICQ